MNRNTYAYQHIVKYVGHISVFWKTAIRKEMYLNRQMNNPQTLFLHIYLNIFLLTLFFRADDHCFYNFV